VRVCVISDTHGAHHSLTLPPSIDVLICCGDFTEDGTEDQVASFIEWYAAQRAKHRLLICGNHEVNLTQKAGNDRDRLSALLSAGGAVTYLQDSLVEAAGLRIYGTPWMPRPTTEVYAHGAWCIDGEGPELAGRYRAIPEGLDLLITHTPPQGVLDNNGL
jgi:hypothetical protein